MSYGQDKVRPEYAMLPVPADLLAEPDPPLLCDQGQYHYSSYSPPMQVQLTRRTDEHNWIVVGIFDRNEATLIVECAEKLEREKDSHREALKRLSSWQTLDRAGFVREAIDRERVNRWARSEDEKDEYGTWRECWVR